MALRDAHEVLAVLAAPALVCTRGATVLALNEGAARWLGTSAAGATGRPLEALLDTSGEPVANIVDRCLSRDHVLCDGPFHRRGDDARRYPMACLAQRLVGVDPADRLLLTFAHAAAADPGLTVSTSASIGAMGVQAGGEAEGGDARSGGSGDLGEVALGLFHEALQPLTAVSAYANSCRRWVRAGRADHPKLLPTLDRIVDQVHAAGLLVASLRDRVGERADARLPCDLNRVVREALELLALDPRVERCAIESRLESDDCTVVVNPGQIQLVLLNLMRNALEASLAMEGGEPRVGIVVRAEPDRASVTVSDSGAGVMAGANERLFEPFVSGKANGLGLGLVICRRVASAHAGRIECLSDVARGAAFQLSLPRAG